MTPEELEPVSALAARLLSALANQKRLLIMSYLFQGELSVNTLAQKVNLSQSALSQHLAKLRAVGIGQSVQRIWSRHRGLWTAVYG